MTSKEKRSGDDHSVFRIFPLDGGAAAASRCASARGTSGSIQYFGPPSRVMRLSSTPSQVIMGRTIRGSTALKESPQIVVTCSTAAPTRE